jgi:uncharacterized protein (DUF885 family)
MQMNQQMGNQVQNPQMFNQNNNMNWNKNNQNQNMMNQNNNMPNMSNMNQVNMSNMNQVNMSNMNQNNMQNMNQANMSNMNQANMSNMNQNNMQNMNQNNMQNMNQNNVQNMNQNNQVFNNNNNNQMNLPSNYQREHYKTSEEGSIMSIIERSPSLIDKNEINEIVTIVQQIYSSFLSNSNQAEYISDVISSKIKHKIHGEWFVLVSESSKNIPFNFSTISESDILTIKIGKTKFYIAKLK